MINLNTIDFDNCSKEDWQKVINTFDNNQPAEIHENTYWYFLEVLPPYLIKGCNVGRLLEKEGNIKVLANIQNLPGNDKITGMFAFKEGHDKCRIFGESKNKYYYLGNTIKEYPGD